MQCHNIFNSLNAQNIVSNLCLLKLLLFNILAKNGVVQYRKLLIDKNFNKCF